MAFVLHRSQPDEALAGGAVSFDDPFAVLLADRIFCTVFVLFGVVRGVCRFIGDLWYGHFWSYDNGDYGFAGAV